MPKTVICSGFYDKHNCPQRDSIPGPHTLQSDMLPLDHCDLQYIYTVHSILYFLSSCSVSRYCAMWTGMRRWRVWFWGRREVCLKNCAKKCDWTVDTLLLRINWYCDRRDVTMNLQGTGQQWKNCFVLILDLLDILQFCCECCQLCTPFWGAWCKISKTWGPVSRGIGAVEISMQTIQYHERPRRQS